MTGPAVPPLEWPEIAGRLAAARSYWLHTTDPGGAPQVSVVWGVVVGGALYHYSERTTVKARNLRHDPRVAVHLESGADVVIVYGLLADLGMPGAATEVIEAFAAKYDGPDERPFLPESNPDFDILYRLVPKRALLWVLPDTDASMRRWIATEKA